MSWSGPRPLSALLVVDRSIEAADGRVVVVVVEGNLAVKRCRKKGRRVWLESAAREPNNYPPIEVTAPDAIVWGRRRRVG